MSPFFTNSHFTQRWKGYCFQNFAFCAMWLLLVSYRTIISWWHCFANRTTWKHTVPGPQLVITLSCDETGSKNVPGIECQWPKMAARSYSSRAACVTDVSEMYVCILCGYHQSGGDLRTMMTLGNKPRHAEPRSPLPVSPVLLRACDVHPVNQPTLYEKWKA